MSLSIRPGRLVPWLALAAIVGPGLPSGVSAAFTSGRTLTIDAAQVGGAGGSLLDFPVVVNLTDRDLRTTGSGGQVAFADGRDIIFKAYDAATCGGPASCTLDHEIETYDGVNGILVAWVRIPGLSKSNDTTITMHFGDNTIPGPTENPTAVWDTNFQAVWHLDETPADNTAGHIDATSNPNDATPRDFQDGDGGTTSAAGKIGGADDFVPMDDRVEVPESPVLEPSGDLTIEAWIKMDTLPVPGTRREIFYKHHSAPPFFPYQIAILEVAGDIQAAGGWVNDSSMQFFSEMNTGSLATDTWYHLALVHNGTDLRLYVNGSNAGINNDTTSGTLLDTDDTVRIGATWFGSTDGMDGIIDEVRFSDSARSADWVLTSHNNQVSAFPFFRTTVNYRSIGTDNSNLHTGGTVSIGAGSTTLTFTNPLPAATSVGAVGPGDELDVAGEIFHIVRLDSSTQVTVDHAAHVDHLAEAGYTVSRAYNLIANWEAGREGDLVVANRAEVGVAYKDGLITERPVIDDSTTDANHFITLTVAEGQRHDGTAGTGVVLDGETLRGGIAARDDYTVVEWFEVIRTGGQNGTSAVESDAPNVIFQQLLIHDFKDASFTVYGVKGSNGSDSMTVRNSIIYDGDSAGVITNQANVPRHTANIENCTIYGMTGRGIYEDEGDYTVTNTISMGNGNSDFDVVVGTQLNNMSDDGTASCGVTCKPSETASAQFVNVTPLDEANWDFHLMGGSTAIDAGTSLSSSFVIDVDRQRRFAGLAWDMGADESAGVTAVDLVSFEATGYDTEVRLEWETGSEVDNLGFHLYRSTSPTGVYQRITSRVIPGLGSSPEGARYSYRDGGLTNGVNYYYELEDIETTGNIERHGPVSAIPAQGAELTDRGDSSMGEENAAARIVYGDPSRNHFRVLRRNARNLTLELVTEGFYAVPQSDGTVRLDVPNFVDTATAGSPAIPVHRAWVEALAGRKVELLSVREDEVNTVTGLRPSFADVAELVASAEGTVRARRRKARRRPVARGLLPGEPARVVETAFQQEVKKALVELAPLRWDPSSGRLLLARRLVVRLSFRGREPSESTVDGRRGRRRRNVKRGSGTMVARLVTVASGLYGVAYEEVFSRSSRPIPATSVRLSRQGEAVAFHIEPDPAAFGEGSTLYFLSDGEKVNPYGREAVYQLEMRGDGIRMETGSAAPSGEAIPHYFERLEAEENRLYQATLIDAPDPWLWDHLLSPETKSFLFEISALAMSAEPARLEVWLQGTSDFPADIDHHVRAYVNGTLVTEALWDGRRARRLDGELGPGVLREGENLLELESVGDAEAAYSMVMLDRYAVSYPRRLLAEDGSLRGSFFHTGTATIENVGTDALVVDVTEPGGPRWLRCARGSSDGVEFHADAGRRYLVVNEVKRARVRRPTAAWLHRRNNRADYVVIGPRSFFDAARELVTLRQQEGLRSLFVPIEDIYSEFGFGESTPEAVKDFLAFAYHEWKRPSLRYVLLLGDATYDFEDRLGTGVQNQVPPFMIQTTHLRTVSDPSLAAVNGDDLLPDVALGRLPAASVDEVRSMVDKIVAYETGAVALDGTAVLVADDRDQAGDFVSHAESIASTLLSGRTVQKIYLGELGPLATQNAILESFDSGPSLVSYIGHGGIHLWADENVFNVSNVGALDRQSRQPILLTMNCLNGYFHFPYSDSLAEALLKAEDKGVVAAFSPSGMSLDAPAHQLHRTVLDQLLHHGHGRLGDALLEAQSVYLETGAYPELLSIYHLLGDPALNLKPSDSPATR